jgi:hypothetical protein
VIQGNYKLVVLGRQAPSSSDASAAVVDMSGGHVVDQDSAPNANVMCVEYVQTDGVWTVFEDNGSGNLTSKFHGQHRELFTGSHKQSYVGSSPGGYDGDLTQTPHKDNDPKIVDKTWAQSIETYVGSDGKPVPTIHAWTGAGEINNVVVAGAVTSTTTALAVTETTLGIKTAIVVGASTEIVVGAATEIVGGINLDIGLTKLQFFNLKSVVAAESTEATTLRNRLAAIDSRISGVSSRISDQTIQLNTVDTRLTNAVNEVSVNVNRVSANVTDLSAAHNELSTEVNVIALEIQLL